MVWVGAKSKDKSEVYNEEVDTSFGSDDVVWNPDSSRPGEFKVDYDLVINNIADLNVLAGDGTHKIQHTTDGARLKVRECMYVAVLDQINGLLLCLTSTPFFILCGKTFIRC